MANPPSPWYIRGRDSPRPQSYLYEFFIEIEPAIKAYADIVGRQAQRRLEGIGNYSPDLEYWNLIAYVFEKILEDSSRQFSSSEELKSRFTFAIKGRVHDIIRLKKSKTPHLAIDNSLCSKPHTLRPEDGRLVSGDRVDAAAVLNDFVFYVQRRDPSLIPLLQEKLSGNLKPRDQAVELGIPVKTAYLMGASLRKLAVDYGLIPPRAPAKGDERSSSTSSSANSNAE